ncbi:hypothetical protein J18TS1_12770 [Oceanobacillus oncorhynchi subsp. incaldanensis]|uniref:hypothetical protein n=1 Tax=Oceanobacillus oncorhynchi TaxID=545501 RepID=UPI001B0090A8|nr:hypothetical protein [Oceanobacillus oncorhynchi]GIO18177.1 hypothetical protein J18TS1_12770 [Oceanobacillus oncorhynchi subsp. incaldanensis]
MKKKFKITIPFIDREDGGRFIDALDLQTGITYGYYESEVRSLHKIGLGELENYLMRRMHLIRSGAYDDAETEK